MLYHACKLYCSEERPDESSAKKSRESTRSSSKREGVEDECSVKKSGESSHSSSKSSKRDGVEDESASKVQKSPTK